MKEIKKEVGFIEDNEMLKIGVFKTLVTSLSFYLHLGNAKSEHRAFLHGLHY